MNAHDLQENAVRLHRDDCSPITRRRMRHLSRLDDDGTVVRAREIFISGIIIHGFKCRSSTAPVRHARHYARRRKH